MKKALSLLVAVALLASMSVFAMTNASAATAKWTLPLDVTDEKWQAESFNYNGAYKWGAPLAEVDDTIIGTSVADGVELKFPPQGTGKLDMTYPLAFYADAAGLVDVTEDDYINFKVSCGEQDQIKVRWQLLLTFSGNEFSATKALMDAGYKTSNDDGKQIVGGDVEFSAKISDIAKIGEFSNGTYDGIWGAGGNNKLTGVKFYIYSEGRDDSVSLVVKELTIGEKGAAAGDNGGAAADNGNNGGTTSTANKAPSASKAPSGSKAPVKTGESVLPIVGVAALAVVAGSAVVVSRKRK